MKKDEERGERKRNWRTYRSLNIAHYRGEKRIGYWVVQVSDYEAR